MCVLRRLLGILLVGLAVPAASFAGNVGARFTTDRATYLLGEPVIVSLTVTNNGGKTIWLEFKPPGMGLLCYDFSVEVRGADSPEPWGCGMAGSCGRGLMSVEAGKSITRRRLLNREYRFRLMGSYAIHASATVMVRDQDLWDSPVIDQVEADDTISIKMRRGSENQLRAAFQPFATEIDSPDTVRQNDAVSAITELAPSLLEDVLVHLTKTKHAGSAIIALRKVNTPKAWDVLAQIATGDGDRSLRIAAIENLGRTSGAVYLPALFELMQSQDKEIRAAAANAAAELGKSDSVPHIVMLLSSGDSDARQAGANSLGRTHAQTAVPLLIGLLADSDANVRQAAVSSLFLLTHRAALDKSGWSDVTTSEGAAAVHARWVAWWRSHGSASEMHGMSDCAAPEAID
jgi:HEAT repeat protein